MKEIIVIVGPTGVGKTKVSIELAKALNGEIINADSVSIYKRLNIGSAKPTMEEQKEAKHHLIDIKDITEEYNIYEYQRDCREKIKEITEKNKRVIIVGGTGLYIKAALYNYELNKEENNNTYDNLSNNEILDKIKKYDSSIDIHVNNRRRLIRYLNKLENNQNIGNKSNELLYNIKVIGLTTERNILYDRINDRVEKMMNNGLLEEVKKLKEYYSSSRILNSAIGYKEFYDYFYNNKSLSDVIDEIKKSSRRYAKRQYTFFNNQFDVSWFNVDLSDINNTINQIITYLS